ncbi:MAG: PAS domain S-box protein, partial [Candidatus Marinimicrobia bacterium]|nr:PAS domain S-box protein [Candidatus Neomarinimicrobiota bacterium]
TYGYSEPEALKMNVTDLVPEDYKAEALNFIVSLKKGELVTSLETKRLTQDGKTLDVWMVVTKLVDENGKLIGAATTERDITERKQSVEELKFSNQQFEAALKDLEAFSYSVSHDLRAPLRHISGYVELLQDTFHDVLPEKGKHYLESIASSSHEMSALIDNLLQFSRTGRAEMHKSGNEMNHMVHAVIKSISADNAERSISWHVEKLPMVRCDAQLIKQVWINLLDNALKYTRTRANAKIDIGVKEETNEYIFFVRDNGVGFDMQYAQKLFGVFQRLHSTGDFEGTGIGLAIVRQIISRHGGRTWAEAELDNGATFYFSLTKE